MTAEVLLSGRSEFDNLIDEMEQVFKKYDECLINRGKIAAEVSGGSTLCCLNLLLIQCLLNLLLIQC